MLLVSSTIVTTFATPGCGVPSSFSTAGTKGAPVKSAILWVTENATYTDLKLSLYGVSNVKKQRSVRRLRIIWEKSNIVRYILFSRPLEKILRLKECLDCRGAKGKRRKKELR